MNSNSTGIKSIVLPTDLKAQKTITEETFSSTGTLPTLIGSARLTTVDDSDDDHSLGHRETCEATTTQLPIVSEQESFNELNEDIEQRHGKSDVGGSRRTNSFSTLDDLGSEYDKFEDKSEHWQNGHHHHHIDDILYMDVTENEAAEILLKGIDIAEKWADRGLVALYKGQYMMRNENYEEASTKFEESLGYYAERTPEVCEETGVLDLTPHLCSLLIECYHNQDVLHRSISVAKEWISRYPTNPSPRCAMAWILREMGQWTDSISICTWGIEKLPETEMIMTLYDIRGKNYYTIGEYEKAVRDFEKVKSMSSKNLARFIPDKPDFINVNDFNPRKYPQKVMSKGRPDLTMRNQEVNRRVLELYSIQLAENRPNTPKPSPQTYEDLMVAQLGSSRPSSSSSSSNMSKTSAAFFSSLFKTARDEMREKEKKETMKTKPRRVYPVQEGVGRHCSKCHLGVEFFSSLSEVDGADFGAGAGESKTAPATMMGAKAKSPTRAGMPSSPKRLLKGIDTLGKIM
jgi:tetratricopeptide (TPR) repeat protein